MLQNKLSANTKREDTKTQRREEYSLRLRERPSPVIFSASEKEEVNAPPPSLRTNVKQSSQ
ncbi:MAG: hypothetical protein LBR18_06240 [Tannerella sp.]|nr:hypothetical protein [Tannerella sp.]